MLLQEQEKQLVSEFDEAQAKYDSAKQLYGDQLEKIALQQDEVNSLLEANQLVEEQLHSSRKRHDDLAQQLRDADDAVRDLQAQQEALAAEHQARELQIQQLERAAAEAQLKEKGLLQLQLQTEKARVEYDALQDEH